MLNTKNRSSLLISTIFMISCSSLFSMNGEMEHCSKKWGIALGLGAMAASEGILLSTLKRYNFSSTAIISHTQRVLKAITGAALAAGAAALMNQEPLCIDQEMSNTTICFASIACFITCVANAHQARQQRSKYKTLKAFGVNNPETLEQTLDDELCFKKIAALNALKVLPLLYSIKS